MNRPLSLQSIFTSQSRSRTFFRVISYVILAGMAIVMLMPLLWLLNGSLQPSWQINANPVIWLPREWKAIPAGTTGRSLLLWWATPPGGSKPQEVIQVGARRYTTVIDPTRVSGLVSVPKDALSAANPQRVDGVQLNLREWSATEGKIQVVALARDPKNENNLIVAPLSGLTGAFAQQPLDVVNQGKMKPAAVGSFELDARTFADGKQLLVVGPESELAVVGPPRTAANAILVQSDRLSGKEFINVGQTQLATYTVEGQPPDARYTAIVQEKWQPILPQDLVASNGLLVKIGQLSSEKETQVINGLNMEVRTYTPDGGQPQPVAVLVPGSDEFLVMPLDRMSTLKASPVSNLVEPGSADRGTMTYRVKEDFEENGVIVPMALVGELQDLSLVVPQSDVTDAFDTPPESMSRSTRVLPNLDGYKKVLALKLSGVPFYMFFVNSGFLVLMNIIGHLFSCTLVAYAFARIRAPGKNVLFIILLGTMMVPGTILTLPTHLVFRDLGALGTMIPLWVRSFFGNAFLIFVLRQFFMTIPYEMDEAAILDGANRMQVLTQIILPLSKAALATVTIFTFWWHWNSFLDPLIYITSQKQFTITLAMNTFNQQYSRSAGYYDRILSGAVLSLLPMVLIFILAQRYFIEGIQMQGLKG